MKNLVHKKKKILIVDDEQFNRIALNVILDSFGVQNTDDVCVYAINGKKALETVKSDVEANLGTYCSFDLILMDCNMPIMDGYESTSLIREFLYQKKLPQPIITGITGHIETQYVKRSINSGMN